MAKDAFRVIVVGGGPVGLTAAHALSKAGIDYVVLEKRENTVKDAGASLVLSAPTMRLFSQLGLLDRAHAVGAFARNNTVVTLDGKIYARGEPIVELMKDCNGCAPLIFGRSDLVQILYDGLADADKARVHAGKGVSSISTSSSGVSVTCTDGSEYTGSIVLGADGVHSRVAKQMRELALKSNPGTTDGINEEKPYQTEFVTMWATFPPSKWDVVGDAWAAHGADKSTMYLCGTEQSWFFLYEKLPKPTRESHRYGEKDIAAYAERFADVALTDKLRVKDVFSQRKAVGLADLEEGILPHWSWQRIVLVGDACHKFTPNQGLGYNNGAQDVVALVNVLRAELEKDGDKKNGTTTPKPFSADLALDRIADVFARYQESRKIVVAEDYKSSGITTRLSAWPNLIYKIIDRYIMPHLIWVQLWVFRKSAEIVATTLVLDFVPGEEPFQGSIPWLHKIKKAE